jgi:pimeloyl-ACP methyl ester carboxylesterase
VETEGIWRAEAIVGGCGFLDFTVGDYGDGMMSGMGSRLYDPETDRWAVTWTSTQNPGKTGIWEGRFGDDGMGEFFRETETPNGTVHSRLRWMNIEGDSADWDYSISPDGVEWTILWEMTLRRLGRKPEAPSQSTPDPDPVDFPATDGEQVYGTWYRAPGMARAVVLAFHQGGASARAEYDPIVPRLAERGLHVLATDQRAGGDLFGGRNRTVETRGGEAGYCDATPDLAGALRRARSEYPDLPILLWGSSYSGALALRLAATNPPGVVAVLAFSPATGEAMTGCKGEAVSGEIRVPVLVLRSLREMERGASRVQIERFRGQGHRVFIADPGAHGSSTLVEERVGGEVEATWRVVNDFIDGALAEGDSLLTY